MCRLQTKANWLGSSAPLQTEIASDSNCEPAPSVMCCACRPQIEQVSQLSSLVESQLQYHKQAVQVLDELYDKLRDR